MKILELPELANIETMKRKDIVSILNEITACTLSEASFMRLNLAIRKGRTVKTLIKWLGYVDSYAEYPLTEYNDTEIGDRIGFVVTKSMSSGGYRMTQKYGEVVAICGKQAIVTNGPNLRRITLETE